MADFLTDLMTGGQNAANSWYGDGPSFGSRLDALFAAMASVPPGGGALPLLQANALMQRQHEAQAHRNAWTQALIASGLPPEQARAYAADPNAAKVVLDQLQRQRGMAAANDFLKTMPGIPGLPEQDTPSPIVPQVAPQPAPSSPQRQADMSSAVFGQPITPPRPMQLSGVDVPNAPTETADVPLAPDASAAFAQAAPADVIKQNITTLKTTPSPDFLKGAALAPTTPAPPAPQQGSGNEKMQAMRLYNWAARATVAGGFIGGDMGKALQELGKMHAETVKGWMTPTDAQKIVAAIPGISAEQRQQILLNTLSDNRPTSVREAQIALENPKIGAEMDRQKKLTQADRITDQVEQRRQAAIAQGLNPKDNGAQQYILTGKMPREDQQPLTATDKKAIMEADEGVLAARTAVDALKAAKLLSKSAYEGPLADKRGYVTSLVGNEAGVATTDLTNLVTTNALSQLKSIFGAAPTEGERKILLEIQGSVNQPDVVRQKIYDRAMALAERRLEFNQQRSNELRGHTFYKPHGGASGSPQTNAPNASSAPGALPRLSSPADVSRMGLKSGDEFIDSNGIKRVVP